MKSFNTYLRIMLLTAGCWFAAGLYAAEEGMEEEGMAKVGMSEDEGMLEEEGEKLPPLYTSKIEIGAGYTSEDDFKFGEYNGLEDQGGFAVGSIQIRKFSQIGNGDNNFWEFSGTNLGLDNRNIFMEYSHDGTYGEYSKNNAYSAFFEYDQIPHNQFDDGRTPFNGAGTADQTLPAGWVGAGSTAGLTALIPSLKGFEMETERQRFGGGFKWKFADSWQALANYRHEIKEGADPIGAIFGSSGGNPRGSILAVPINYDTDEFNISLAYTGDKAQYNLSYHLSLFDNNDGSVIWDNPFNNGAWAAGSNFADGARGQLSLFPDNQAHSVNLTAGYNFSPRTRGTATFTYGRMLQDENFLPYSNVHPTVTPLPRNSLDGDIQTLFANLNLYSRLTDKLDVRARYTYDDRDNQTPRDTYIRIAGDAETQPAITTDNARTNWTYDMTRHKLELDSSYRLIPQAKVAVGYEFETKSRNFSEVDDTYEHTGKIKLSGSPFDTADGWIKYARSNRDGSEYISNQPFIDGHDAAHRATLTLDEMYENDFSMRKYHFADRDRNQLQTGINFYPIEKWVFAFNGEYRDDDYYNTEIGLRKSRNYNLTLDINFNPNDKLNLYAFLTHENFKYDQTGFRRAGNHTFAPGDSRYAFAGEDYWTTDTEDKTNMVGTGLDWLVMQDKLKLMLDLTYSRTYTHFDQFSGPRLTGGNVAARLPDVVTRLGTLNLTGEYQIKENMKARLRYAYERFESRDFGLDGVGVDTLSNVILLGNGSPNYVEHLFAISFVYEFQ